MYDNIGKKIKGLAKAIFIIEIIAIAIIGIIVSLGLDLSSITYLLVFLLTNFILLSQVSSKPTDL